MCYIVKMQYILLENSDFRPDHNSGRIKKVLAGIMKLVLVLAAWPALSGQN